MKRSLVLSAAAFLFASFIPAQTPAPNPDMPVDWLNLCADAKKDLLVVTTETNDTIQGYCLFVQRDELIVRTVDGKTVRLARGTLRKVLAIAGTDHRLKALGKITKQGLHNELKLTFSPMAPVGLAGIPATLAWGAVATPFCILGDLFGGKPTQRVLSVRQ